MRSRTVSRPESCCRLTLSGPPISRANASRLANSSSPGFQFTPVLRVLSFCLSYSYPALHPSCQLRATQAGRILSRKRIVHSALRNKRLRGNGMPEIKILTEVAGRICAIPASVGAVVSDGDDLVLVE